MSDGTQRLRGDSTVSVVLDAPGVLRSSAVEVLKPQHQTLARLRHALDIGRIGTWSWDLRTNTAEWDPSLLALIGFPASAPRRGDMQELLEIIHPEDRDGVVAEMDKHLALAASYEVEFRSVDADGATRWILCRAQLTRGPDGVADSVQGVCVDITQRKRVETKLQRVIRTLKAARVATFFWDAVASTVSWEDEACIAFPGVSGVVFECDIDFVLARIDARDRERAQRAFQQAAEGGGTVRLTCLGENDVGGVATWFEVVVVGSDDATDGGGTLAGAFVDITSHKLLERQLLAARNKLELAMLAGEVGTQIWDIQAGTLESDGLLDTFFGCSGAQLLSGGVAALVPNVDPRHRAQVTELYAQAIRHGQPTNCTYRYCRPDGTWVWLTTRSITECDVHGNPARVISAVADVTELKSAEERLRTQSDVSAVLAKNDATEDAVRAALDLVCVCEGLDGGAFWRVDAATHGFENVAMRLPDTASADDVAKILRGGSATGDLVFPRARRFNSLASVSPPRPEPFADTAARTGFSGRFALPVFAESECMGVLVFVGRTPLVEDEDMLRFMEFVGVQLALFVRRRQAEHALQQLNGELEERVRARTSELEQSNKELEGFSYSISHDLRTPLRAVDGFSQALIAEYSDMLPAEGRRLVGAIRDGAQRMGDLIDDLLDFSRLSRAPVRKRAFDTDALVDDCLAMLASELGGRKITITRSALPICVGDRALLKQVWINLLSNALKYTRQRAHAELEISAKVEAGAVVFAVRDNGAGFDMRYVHKLFGVFRRLHRAEDYEGTGVGLAIAQRIVQRHGGRIWAEAKVGEGASFFFTLDAEAQAR